MPEQEGEAYLEPRLGGDRPLDVEAPSPPAGALKEHFRYLRPRLDPVLERVV
jgi:hypothetical protein